MPTEKDYADLSDRVDGTEHRLSELEKSHELIVRRIKDLSALGDKSAALILSVMVVTIGVIICFAIWLVLK